MFVRLRWSSWSRRLTEQLGKSSWSPATLNYEQCVHLSTHLCVCAPAPVFQCCEVLIRKFLLFSFYTLCVCACHGFFFYIVYLRCLKVLFEKLRLHERCENKKLPKTVNKQQQSTSEAAVRHTRTRKHKHATQICQFDPQISFNLRKTVQSYLRFLLCVNDTFAQMKSSIQRFTHANTQTNILTQFIHLPFLSFHFSLWSCCCSCCSFRTCTRYQRSF